MLGPIHLAAVLGMVWPMPRHLAVTPGVQRHIDPVALQFEGDAPEVLRAALERFRRNCCPHTATNPTALPLITRLRLDVADAHAELQYGVHEGYNLSTAAAVPWVRAATAFGALHALESLAQLMRFDWTLRVYAVPAVAIEDAPRFGWRELMLDTARHFLPVPVIKMVVDSMAAAKVRVPPPRRRQRGLMVAPVS